jgi:hypothetical protein
MSEVWEHPELGRFEYDGVEWSRAVELPGFGAFDYQRDEDDAKRLTFAADDEGERPTAEMAALAAKVLANQRALAERVVAALWEDVNGRGPRSGMWWHGASDDVADAMEEDGLPRPAAAGDLITGLRVMEVCVRPHVEGYDRPVAELTFAAAFEQEHGLGVLTDGERILGIGYMGDAEPFRG